MGKRKKLSREEYAAKFAEQMEQYNYVWQDGEEVVQCKPPYPDYWFASNKGYVLTAHRKEIKVLKPNHRYTGAKNKDGNRNGQDWYYEYHVSGEKHNRHVTMHKLISDTFLTSEFADDGEKLEVHHKIKKNTFKPDEAQSCNSVDNLQLLPKSVHQRLTHYASKTSTELDQELLKKAEEAGCPILQMPQEQLQNVLLQALISTAQNGAPATFYSTTLTDNVAEIEAEAHPVKSIKIS